MVVGRVFGASGEPSRIPDPEAYHRLTNAISWIISVQSRNEFVKPKKEDKVFTRSADTKQSNHGRVPSKMSVPPHDVT